MHCKVTLAQALVYRPTVHIVQVWKCDKNLPLTQVSWVLSAFNYYGMTQLSAPFPVLLELLLEQYVNMQQALSLYEGMGTIGMFGLHLLYTPCRRGNFRRKAVSLGEILLRMGQLARRAHSPSRQLLSCDNSRTNL
jgi:hypothetical protein